MILLSVTFHEEDENLLTVLSGDGCLTILCVCGVWIPEPVFVVVLTFLLTSVTGDGVEFVAVEDGGVAGVEEGTSVGSTDVRGALSLAHSAGCSDVNIFNGNNNIK